MFTRAYPLIHRNRKRTAARPRKVAPAALTLIAATYQDSTAIVLTFDRAIDISGLVGNQIVVDDGAITGVRWEANGAATLVNPATVEIGLVDFASAAGPTTVLNAGPGNGIVATDDGGTWGGVTDVELPFP